MEPQDNKPLALQKAISSHEQALAALADLMSVISEDGYKAMVDRIERNIAELHKEADAAKPGDRA